MANAIPKDEFSTIISNSLFCSSINSVALLLSEMFLIIPCAALDKSILRIEDAVMETLSKTPPELAADIYNTGIYLAGGGSMLRGLDKRLSRKTDLPVYVAEDPLRAVVRGTGIALKNLEKYKTVLIK